MNDPQATSNVHTLLHVLHHTTSPGERISAQEALLDLQKAPATWQHIPLWLANASLEMQFFAVQALHVKINSRFTDLDEEHVEQLRRQLVSWLDRPFVNAVRLKLSSAYISLLVRIEKHPVSLVLNDITLLTMLPEEVAKQPEQYSLKHELAANSYKVITALRQHTVNEQWLECLKSWSPYFDKVPQGLLPLVISSFAQHLFLCADIFGEWFTKEGGKFLVHHLPTTLSSDPNEVAIQARLYGAYGEAHTHYILENLDSLFVRTSMELTTKVTCDSLDLDDPLLVCPVWEFWYCLHEVALEHDQAAKLHALYTVLLQNVLRMARLPAKWSRQTALFARKVRRELADIVTSCLNVLGPSIFVQLVVAGVADQYDFETRLWTANVVSDDLQEHDLSALAICPPPDAFVEAHRQALLFMLNFPQYGSIDFISSRLPGPLSLEAARALEGMTEFNHAIVQSLFEGIYDLIQRCSTPELKVILCRTVAKGKVGSQKLCSLLESIPCDFMACAEAVVKVCPFDEGICQLILSRLDSSNASLSALTAMVTSFGALCVCCLRPLVPHLASLELKDCSQLVNLLASIIQFGEDDECSKAILDIFASRRWDYDSWQSIFDLLTKVTQRRPELVTASFVETGLLLLRSMNTPLFRSIVRFVCQLSASSQNEILRPYVPQYIDVGVGLVACHLASSQIEPAARMLFELIRLDHRNAQAHVHSSVSRLGLDASWTGRLIQARTFGRFREACEAMARLK